METSQSIANIAKALSMAQGQFKPIKRELVNPFYHSKYADLSAIIDATKEALSKNGLAICQLPVPNTVKVDGEERVYLDTLLAHESGEWIKCSISLIPKADDPQAIGSAMTYARRYSLGAILGVASEDDDDGNAAAKPEVKTEQHYCKEHKTPFFKRGNMKTYAHQLPDKTWCNEKGPTKEDTDQLLAYMEAHHVTPEELLAYVEAPSLKAYFEAGNTSLTLMVAIDQLEDKKAGAK